MKDNLLLIFYYYNYIMKLNNKKIMFLLLLIILFTIIYYNYINNCKLFEYNTLYDNVNIHKQSLSDNQTKKNDITNLTKLLKNDRCEKLINNDTVKDTYIESMTPMKEACTITTEQTEQLDVKKLQCNLTINKTLNSDESSTSNMAMSNIMANNF